jgi:hypothetical protein
MKDDLSNSSTLHTKSGKTDTDKSGSDSYNSVEVFFFVLCYFWMFIKEIKEAIEDEKDLKSDLVVEGDFIGAQVSNLLFIDNLDYFIIN